MDDQLLFGKKVRAVREAANLSRELAAEKAGITVSYLGEVERGAFVNLIWLLLIASFGPTLW